MDNESNSRMDEGVSKAGSAFTQCDSLTSRGDGSDSALIS
jgi:hypothetical protein